jgi:uncharacterized GH25 family protein
MKRRLPFVAIVLVLGVACPAPVRAHFIWLVPSEPGAKMPAVRVMFSEDLRFFDPDLLKKVARTELFARDADGKTKTIKAAIEKDEFAAQLPDAGLFEVAAVCRYGVIQRGKSEPFLLHYDAKTFILPDKKPSAPLALLDKAWDKLPLEIVPVSSRADRPRVRVLWQGKALAGAEVVLLVPGREENVEGKTDKDGLFPLTAPTAAGLYGIRVLHKEAREGEFNGKKYKEVRHYATLTLRSFDSPQGKALAQSSPTVDQGKLAAKPDADPAATKLLTDARAARALYHNFPGFSADIEINTEGQVTHGSVEISDKGKVTLKVENADAEKWAKNTLGSIIGHRLGGGPDEETPCAFADNDAHHPLGRAIRVLNDEFHSSYRIRDRQVIIVNRSVPGSRFTITVMENIQTKEKKFLPACYVVNTWDAKTDALTSSETHHQTWQRVGVFDLPKETLAVKATAGKLDSRSIKLSNIRLK